jgi:hypothetical protein
MEKIIPRNAALYLHIENPEAFINNTEAFLVSAGLGAFLDSRTLGEIIDGAAALTQAGIIPDYRRPAGFALVPGPAASGEDSSPMENYDFILCLPLTPESGEGLKNQGLPVPDTHYRILDNYLIWSGSGELIKNRPAAGRLDFDRIGAYPSDGITFYANFPALLSGLSINWEDLTGELDESYGSELAPVWEGYRRILASFQEQWSTLRVDGETLSGLSEIRLTGELGELSASISPVSDLGAGAPYLWTEANVLQVLVNLSPEDQVNISETLSRLLSAGAFFKDKDNWDKLEELQNRISETLGARGAAGFNLSLAPETEGSPSPLDRLSRLSAEFLAIHEVRDPALLARLLDEYQGSLSLAQGLFDGANLAPGFHFSLEGEKFSLPDGAPGWAYEYRWQLESQGALAEAFEEAPQLEEFYRNFFQISYFLAVKNGLQFSYLYYNVPDARNRFYELINQFPRTQAVPSWVSEVPGTAHGAFSLRPGALILPFVSDSPFTDPLPPEPGSLTLFFQGGAPFRTGFNLSSREVAYFVQLAMLFASR